MATYTEEAEYKSLGLRFFRWNSWWILIAFPGYGGNGNLVVEGNVCMYSRMNEWPLDGRVLLQVKRGLWDLEVEKGNKVGQREHLVGSLKVAPNCFHFVSSFFLILLLI